jgi:hypothetical protein
MVYYHFLRDSDPCANAPSISGTPNNTLDQAPDCAGNGGQWKQKVYVTLVGSLGAAFELVYWHSIVASPTWPGDYSQVGDPTTDLTKTLTAKNGYGPLGGGAGPITAYSKWRVEVRPIGRDTVCDSAYSDQDSVSDLYACTV